MKRVIVIAGLLAMFGGSAYASGDGAGCGLGSMVFKGQKGMIPNLLAATTNGTSGSQTFGITSGTSNCKADAVVQREHEQRIFVAANLDTLSQQMAQGSGAHVSALAGLMGCSTESQGEFARMGQEKYGVIFSSTDAQPEAVLATLKDEMGRHPTLAASCTRIA